ncbi:hypothetical protein Daus18300_005504 [Diaporthe australafricana]|uniref:Ribosomal RNA methyltransferase FtsJ domain-containing protein n=1 Tax=Diaporthe australafricana TaxID=127596 RepID=A0ABR3X151_9PEZI
MRSPDHISPSSKVQAIGAVDPESIGKMLTNHAITNDPEEDIVVRQAIEKIEDYLMENAPVYRELQDIRAKGWENLEGDRFFENRQRQADESSGKVIHQVRILMEDISKEIQCFTRAFTIRSTEANPQILDMCMAPGVYLAKALERNPNAHAVAFTLPPSQGGHIPTLSESETLKIHLLDITMLAADMGIKSNEIPQEHPDAANFLPRHFDDGQSFDLVLYDGILLRSQDRAAYRFYREFSRLLLTQLALGLEHLRPGGTMIILLHKVERIINIRLLRDFARFATVKLFKPKSGHAKRSSFYMIASEIRSRDKEAIEAVQGWKREWKIATLGTDGEWREDYTRVASFGDLGIDGVLEEFGPTLIKLGQKVWRTQADALKVASFNKK